MAGTVRACCAVLAVSTLTAPFLGAQTNEVPRTRTFTGLASPPFPYVRPEEVGLSNTKLEWLADEIVSWVDAGELVGAELLIVKDEKAVFHEAFGWSDRENEVPVELEALIQTIEVRAEGPSVPTWSTVPAAALCDYVSQDIAETLRLEPRLSSVRRGPVNLEPTVRGLSEQQVAMLVDGTRTFAAGPGRMDSDISHVSPTAVSELQLVKGPYALTWGAGAMSATQLQTTRPEFETDALSLHGIFGVDYAGNGDRTVGRVGLWGSDSRTRFMLQHSSRFGNDYEDGNGDLVQGDYESFDTRWGLGFQLTPELTIDYSGGFQKQRNIDYPGLVMDAVYFDTQSHAVDLSWRAVHGQVYLNFKDHLMNNDNKPTADRGLDVEVPTESNTYGGRLYTVFEQGALEWKLVSTATRITRTPSTIARRDTGRALSSGVDVRAGVLNLTNTAYATHLNALDPFRGARIRERGRAVYLGIDYEF